MSLIVDTIATNEDDEHALEQSEGDCDCGSYGWHLRNGSVCRFCRATTRLPKLSEVFDHPDDVVNAIEAWVKDEAEVGLMVAYDARRVQEAGRILKQRIDDAYLNRPNKFNKKENKNVSH